MTSMNALKYGIRDLSQDELLRRSIQKQMKNGVKIPMFNILEDV